MSRSSKETMEPLTALIVGAGIGGLSAAIFLRHQGHKVLVFERSKFSAEVGAAIHVAPNCQRLLTRMGISTTDHGGTPLERVINLSCRNYIAPDVDLTLTSYLLESSPWEMSATLPLTQVIEKAGANWDLIHRADLHSALRNRALSREGAGSPVQLFLNTRIIDMDVQNATLTLAGGDVATGDLVIGADGAHSWTRAFVAPESQPQFPWGKCCFRWLVPYEELNEKFQCDNRNTLIEWTGPDRRIICYPCSNHSIANFGAFVPSTEVTTSNREWNNRASKEQLLQCFEKFDPSIRQILNQVPEDGLKIWELFDMQNLPSWANDCSALLGDAAHPFLPFMAQGGAMAIEDGASIGALFPLGTSRADIPSRLQMYEQCRKDRVERIQDFTRRSGRNNDGSEGPRPKGNYLIEILCSWLYLTGIHFIGEEVASFLPFCIDHDEWENSSRFLAEQTHY
ncbi:uncharacterized protein N7496_008841 [Penicillium cataractarum]|uniref:FAD-binding domain-containing protein n=1 Tax=Penicillium cataractarum TaxID=2100454 RepID=A0A9W9RZF3_9EURO|nr:uncharacterized protein N7496_008841 [Penicillium cataractarum]KAJ5369081.1 hypothetical protein N7496_008841 [Penicillium cataractarum]